MRKKSICACLLLTSLFLVLGCGSNVKLKGRVTYSDDNSPLPVGMVCFETDNFSARGALNSDGYYTVGSLTDKDGLPKGTYRVHIASAEMGVPNEKGGPVTIIPLIDPKYKSPDTSGLVVEVTPSNRKFDFQVDRPGK